MPINYLYLDDELVAETQSFAQLLETENSLLKIKVENPRTFSNQLVDIGKRKIDGLILDLRLDERTNNNEKAEYRAFTLAQEIRARATEGILSDFPIVICSTDNKLKRFYEKAIVGHDLFDAKYLKTEEMVRDSERVANELVSLAKGYKLIGRLKKSHKKFSIANLFILSKENLSFLDERLTKFFFGTLMELPISEYARFIFKEMIIKPGVLLDKKHLLARFGLRDDAKDVELLLNKLEPFKYKGPFHEAWERWWWPLVLKWWIAQKDPPALHSLSADNRVSILNKILKAKLKPSSLISPSYSSKYWAICQFYKLPLDPIDGLLIDPGYEPLPWQEPQYVSIQAVSDTKFTSSGITINSSELYKLKSLKKKN